MSNQVFQSVNSARPSICGPAVGGLAIAALIGSLTSATWATAAVVALAVLSLWICYRSHRQQAGWQRRQLDWATEAYQRNLLLRQVGHELRTRLNGVLGFADMMLFESPSPESQETLLDIQRHGGYLVHLVADLVDVANSTSGEELVETDFGPNTLVHEALNIVEPEAEAVGKPVSCRFSASTPALVVGRTQGLRQALCNSIQAALHLPGDSVIVEVDFDEAASQLNVKVTNPAGGWSDVAYLSDSPQPVRSLDDDETRNTPWLYFHVAELVLGRFGGKMNWIRDPESELDSLNLCLDVQKSSSTNLHPTIPQVAHRLDNVHLLVIDDSVDNRKIIQHFLESAGATVDVADNGHTGIVMVHSEESRGREYDAVLMDMQMPIMNGYEATQRLRADGCEFPIIAVTAYALEGDRNKCLDAGCDEYVTKPIKRSELLQIVESQLKLQREAAVVV